MRTVAVAALALVGGFIAGIVLSEIIGILGMLIFDDAVGIRFLPILLAVLCAVLAPIADQRIRRSK
ncbi:DUF5957 family protein [Actinopolymorpha alba]|uniref:DUF5957 family protein n=1 Tax=Actinopolymorpha alba TaxID=533267 RepID=UPI00035E6801|nr:DUF5957 family protein [Actinopolymorpha alba]